MRAEPTRRLPPPPGILDSSDMRVQELIYGHRFMQEQEPFMIVLELLAVCASKPLGSIHPSPGHHEAFTYTLPHRRKMRFLLFQDRHLDQVVEDSSIPDHLKWQEWKRRVNLQFGEGQHSASSTGHDAFAYLDQRFSRNISSLHQAVRLLKSRELDVMHNRRWTSRFLAVTGPDLICADMRETRGSWAVDRRFFGRGGELVYLMLNRSSRAKELGELINRRLLNPDAPVNRIAASLSDTAADGEANTHIGYLPFQQSPAYERLAEDWTGVLLSGRLPEGHLFEPLFRITGLNLAVYFGERASMEIGEGRRLPMVVDVTDGSNQQIREDAKIHLNLHRAAANRAAQALIEGVLDQCERWRLAIQRVDPGLAKQALRDRFGFVKGDYQRGNAQTPQEQLEAFIRHATSRDKNNIHKYLLPLSKSSGFVTSRQRVGSWFSLDDQMLFALVLANVDATVELRDFVQKLYQRYGLIIGPQEARAAFGRIHAERYEANLMALEARMTRLKLTQRLSDDCAFVTNPYR